MRPNLEQQLKQLARSLANTGWICPGSLVQQYQIKHRRGRLRRYGPYSIWTRKIGNKTVTVALSEQQLQIVTEGINNRRALEQVLLKMQRLTEKKILAAAR